MEFTWIETYKELAQWLSGKESNQNQLIGLLKEVVIDGFKDTNKEGMEIDLTEIDPFSFFAYLNKYKTDTRRLEILQKIHKTLGLKSPLPEDVNGIPTSHPLKVRLFPTLKLRGKDDIPNLWKLYRQAIKHDIDNTLFQDVLNIRNVGKGKLSISLFYVDPEYYLSLDSKTATYLRKHSLKYTYNSYAEYKSVGQEAIDKLSKKPYEISYDAYSDTDGESGKIGSIRTLLDKLDTLNETEFDDNVLVFYRGHSNKAFELKPSIYRKKELINNEDRLFKDIIAKTPNDFKGCNSTFEKLVKMQHYSLPTRLLDITSNPLVALYFACADNDRKGEDGMLYRFEIKESQLKYFDSDAVSVVANIAKRPISFEVASIIKYNRDKFNKQEAILYLLHEIRTEKPHFHDVIDKEDIGRVFCVKPIFDNPRIIKQEGAFFLYGINGEKSTPADFPFEYTTYTVNKNDKQKILKQLESLGIDESTLFPEIEHVAKHLKEKYDL
ncbi:FRG domain-containing protein [Bacteroides fragilis]|uniref:FRG domain-containing protein n=1 Tax=Bacteroides fragilis TaxID=817 RepID=A0A396BPM0_BACFG|nr:FRG domain-containing protein [Bacteroides fragilis]RHH07924.1 FRG domain-containing protein [Bacteroides fragilis]